jgi:hypothetical protein
VKDPSSFAGANIPVIAAHDVPSDTESAPCLNAESIKRMLVVAKPPRVGMESNF